MNRIDAIEKELDALEIVKQRIKAHRMGYQGDLKARAAEILGVTPEFLDLPYNQWAEIRNRLLKKGKIQI
jgi:hypothetical protein